MLQIIYIKGLRILVKNTNEKWKKSYVSYASPGLRNSNGTNFHAEKEFHPIKHQGFFYVLFSFTKVIVLERSPGIFCFILKLNAKLKNFFSKLI